MVRYGMGMTKVLTVFLQQLPDYEQLHEYEKDILALTIGIDQYNSAKENILRIRNSIH